jgi:hypothetical protein
MHLNRTVAETLIHIYKPGQYSGHEYVYEGSRHYSIKMHVPSQDSVRDMYMCMRVPVTILLRCMRQARTVITRTLSWLGTYIHLNRIVTGTLIQIYMTRLLPGLEQTS